jgi:hypothetical protein
VTRFEITSAERAGWQRRAVAELVRILDTHRDLPLVAWSIANAGASLVGHVHTRGGAAQAREAFEAWRVALGLDERTEIRGGLASLHLRAVADRNQVRVALIATMPTDGPEAVSW